VTAVILTAGTATPFLVAAGGAMLASGGLVAAGTMALNAYQGRPLGQNLIKNIATTTITAFATTSIVSLFAGGFYTIGNSVAGYCAINPSICARADAIMNGVDKLEEVGLVVKGAFQTLRGDSLGASETYLELQMERMDGGVPGNALAHQVTDLSEDALQIVATYEDDAIPLLLKYGDDAVDIIGAYGDEGVLLLKLYGDDAVKLIREHGTPAIRILTAVDLTSAQTLLTTLDDDVLDYAINQGPDAVAALSRWSEKDLLEFGPELALRAKKDAKVLQDIKKLVSMGPIDPKHLTLEQKDLLNKIAKNSMQYNDEGQIVLGKWVDYGNGFTSYARETGSVHYNPHPDMWNLLGDLGDIREETAWLVNKQVIQTGIDTGLPFEYTLSGIKPENLVNETNAIEAIWANATDGEIMDVLRLDYVPIRMQELKVLRDSGYQLSFDSIADSYVLIKP
jgi:hypothetical protein